MDITYCRVCGDGWCDENYMLGSCCGYMLSTRPETPEEERSRKEAMERLLKRAERLNW